MGKPKRMIACYTGTVAGFRLYLLNLLRRCLH